METTGNLGLPGWKLHGNHWKPGVARQETRWKPGVAKVETTWKLEVNLMEGTGFHSRKPNVNYRNLPAMAIELIV